MPIYMQSQAGVLSNRLTWEYSDACEKYVDENGTLSTRTILGVTFDPSDVAMPRPYVSVSTLFWLQYKQIDETASQGYAWSNAEVLGMQLIDPALSASTTASISPTASNTPAISSPSPFNVGYEEEGCLGVMPHH